MRGATGVGIATPAVRGTITDAGDDALTASVAAGATVPEGSAAAFVVTLTGAVSSAPVVVGYEVGGTASARDGDYTAPSGVLTIARGASTGTISIATRDERVLDPGETLTVTLVSATSAGAVALGTATASTTIGDDAEVRVTIGDTTVVEAETAVFTVALTGKVAADVTVGYSATAGPSGPSGATTADYTAPAAGAAVTVTAGETTATIKVATVDDVLAEADETFTVVLDLPDDAPTGVTLGDGYGEATIRDDRPAARLPGAGPGGGAAAGPEGPLAGPGSVAEGDAAVYTLDVPAGVAGGEEVTVSFSTEGSTATAGLDFSPDSGSVTIAADAATPASAAFTIQVADDQVVDLRETLVVTATAAVAGGGALPIAGVARTMIVDPGTVRVSVTADPEIVEERREAATFTVALTGTVAEELTLPWSTGADGDTATADQDYTAVVDAALTIAAQQTTATITVAVTADGQDEADETFTVRLDPDAPAAQVEIATAAARATITDRAAGAGERSVSVTAPETVAEGGVARFTVRVGGAESSAPVTVSYALGGTAEAPADYTAPSAAMVSIAAGRRTATIAIQTRSDRVLEPDETLVVTLTGAQSTGGPVRVGSPRTAATAIQDPVYHSINRVNRALLPGVMRAAAADVLEAVRARVALAAHGDPPAATADPAGLTGLYRALQANERALQDGSYDLARVLEGSSFLLPLGTHGGESGAGLGAAVWGRGDFRAIAGGADAADDVDWKGSVWSARLGADLRIVDHLLTGLALSWTAGELDYVDQLAPADREGAYAAWLIGAYPYVGWSTTRFGLWATGGFGFGGVSIDDSARGDGGAGSRPRAVVGGRRGERDAAVERRVPGRRQHGAQAAGGRVLRRRIGRRERGEDDSQAGRGRAAGACGGRDQPRLAVRRRRVAAARAGGGRPLRRRRRRRR